jgi:hypothetical protein
LTAASGVLSSIADTIKVRSLGELATGAAGRWAMIGLKRLGLFSLAIGAVIVLASAFLGKKARRYSFR